MQKKRVIKGITKITSTHEQGHRTIENIADRQFLEMLKEDRRALVQALIDSERGYDFNDVRKLAEIQGAIAAIEAVIADKEAK
jgi:hypothetical protein